MCQRRCFWNRVQEVYFVGLVFRLDDRYQSICCLQVCDHAWLDYDNHNNNNNHNSITNIDNTSSRL